MRLGQNNAGLSYPFRLTRSNELINDTLSSVVEVTELSFPDDKSIRVGHGITDFESKYTVLRQGAVTYSVGGLIRVQVAQWPVSGLVNSLMMQHMMTVTKMNNILYYLLCFRLFTFPQNNTIICWIEINLPECSSFDILAG